LIVIRSTPEYAPTIAQYGNDAYGTEYWEVSTNIQQMVDQIVQFSEDEGLDASKAIRFFRKLQPAPEGSCVSLNGRPMDARDFAHETKGKYSMIMGEFYDDGSFTSDEGDDMMESFSRFLAVERAKQR